MDTGATEVATLEASLRSRPPGGDEETFWRESCPPLPPNHAVAADEPEVITSYLLASPFKAHARETWTEREWRLHRWAYARLAQVADAQIGRVLAALRETGQEENTVVLFSSDHGDNDGR